MHVIANPIHPSLSQKLARVSMEPIFGNLSEFSFIEANDKINQMQLKVDEKLVR